MIVGLPIVILKFCPHTNKIREVVQLLPCLQRMPARSGPIQGLSTEFLPVDENIIQDDAISQGGTALHVTVSHSVGASIRTQTPALRQPLFETYDLQ